METARRIRGGVVVLGGLEMLSKTELEWGVRECIKELAKLEKMKSELEGEMSELEKMKSEWEKWKSKLLKQILLKGERFSE